jgi:hypothetical protein
MDKIKRFGRNMKRLCFLSGVLLMSVLLAQVEQDEWIDPSLLRDEDNISFDAVRSTDKSILTYIKDTISVNLQDSLSFRKGYRVQILATQDVFEAEAARKRAEQVFNEPVYVVFESPYYKVRLGNFSNDLDARNLERQARQKGYPSSWIVPSDINVANTNRRYP